MTYNQNIITTNIHSIACPTDKLLEFYVFKHCIPKLSQHNVMLSFVFNVAMSEQVDICMHVLLEYT